jgi:hypothetical protein
VSAQQTVSEWEAHGSKFRGMTPSFDLGVEPHDHFTWRWWVKDSEFGDVVATGYASDLATAQSAAAQVGSLMEDDA